MYALKYFFRIVATTAITSMTKHFFKSGYSYLIKGESEIQVGHVSLVTFNVSQVPVELRVEGGKLVHVRVERRRVILAQDLNKKNVL